jgi:hypothetical protein
MRVSSFHFDVSYLALLFGLIRLPIPNRLRVWALARVHGRQGRRPHSAGPRALGKTSRSQRGGPEGAFFF